MWDIIPDIHGQAEKLERLLADLAYRRSGIGWTHPEGRRAVFLGDFIDRGPENGRVIRIVREMQEADRAVAVMGNHELNAVHFHAQAFGASHPLRPHSDKNFRQHGAFLAEFPLGADATHDVVAWMADLPLWLDLGPFRAVHACWDDAAIEKVPDGTLTLDDILHAADVKGALHAPVETLTKGPEVDLPPGWAIHDKEGTRRDRIRLAWWNAAPEGWRDAAISVPEDQALPDGPAPDGDGVPRYGADQKPVFFGHYWLRGTPEMQAANALCMDYSAGSDGPLLAYRFAEGALDLTNIVGMDAR